MDSLLRQADNLEIGQKAGTGGGQKGGPPGYGIAVLCVTSHLIRGHCLSLGGRGSCRAGSAGASPSRKIKLRHYRFACNPLTTTSSNKTDVCKRTQSAS